MCTLVLLRRPDHRWPLLLAANRDELANRPWAPPGRHWADRPEVTAGLDRTAGGSWLGMNDHGLVAAILNRRGSLGPAADKRSRGELVLEGQIFARAASRTLLTGRYPRRHDAGDRTPGRQVPGNPGQTRSTDHEVIRHDRPSSKQLSDDGTARLRLP